MTVTETYKQLTNILNYQFTRNSDYERLQALPQEVQDSLRDFYLETHTGLSANELTDTREVMLKVFSNKDTTKLYKYYRREYPTFSYTNVADILESDVIPNDYIDKLNTSPRTKHYQIQNLSIGLYEEYKSDVIELPIIVDIESENELISALYALSYKYPITPYLKNFLAKFRYSTMLSADKLVKCGIHPQTVLNNIAYQEYFSMYMALCNIFKLSIKDTFETICKGLKIANVYQEPLPQTFVALAVLKYIDTQEVITDMEMIRLYDNFDTNTRIKLISKHSGEEQRSDFSWSVLIKYHASKYLTTEYCNVLSSLLEGNSYTTEWMRDLFAILETKTDTLKTYLSLQVRPNEFKDIISSLSRELSAKDLRKSSYIKKLLSPSTLYLTGA